MPLVSKPSKRTLRAWRVFLGSTEGKEGLEYWKSLRPRVEANPEVHIFAASAGKSDGYDEALQKLEDMILEDEESEEGKQEERLDTSHLERR